MPLDQTNKSKHKAAVPSVAKLSIGVTIEARMNSRRLPGKVMLNVLGKPLIEHMVDRVKRVPGVKNIVLATTTNPSDDILAAHAVTMGIGCYRGSEHNVLSRVLEAAQTYECDAIVELCGDCPLIEPMLIEEVIETYQTGKYDYVANFLKPAYPVGMAAQIFATSTLADVAKRTARAEDLEHVSLYIYRHPEIYRVKQISKHQEFFWPELSLTLDTPEDFLLIRHLIEALSIHQPDFNLSDIIAYLRQHPDLSTINRHVARTIIPAL